MKILSGLILAGLILTESPVLAKGVNPHEDPKWQCWGVYPHMPTPSMKYVNFGPLDPQYNGLDQRAASHQCNVVPLYKSCKGKCQALPVGETPSDKDGMPQK